MDPLAEKNLISTKAASDISGYNSDYLARLCRSGKIIGSQIGRTWLVSQSSLEEFVKSQGARKQELREHLSEKREKEYRQAQLPASKKAGAATRSIAPAFTDYLTRPVKASPFQHQGIAVLASLVALLIGVTASQIIPFASIGSTTLGTVLAVSDGLHDIANDAVTNADAHAQKEFASVDASRYAFVASTSTPQSAVLIDRATSHLAVVNRSGSKAGAFIIPSSNPPTIVSSLNTLRTRTNLLSSFDFNSPLSAAVALASLEVHAYVDTGAQTYVAINNGLSAYANVIQKSGDATLALGTSIRDLGTSAPRASMALAETEVGAARGVSDLSQGIIQGYSDGVYGWVNESPTVSANVAAAEYEKTYEVGSTLATIVNDAPSTIVSGYQAGMNGWVNGTPVVAMGIVRGEIVAGSGVADAATAGLAAEKSAVDTSANLAYGLYQQGALALAVVPETASAPTAGLRASVDDAVLGALGNGSVDLSFLTQDAPRELLAAVQSELPASVLPTPVVALGEQTAVATYDALSGFFNRATNALAYLFGANPAPTTAIASAPAPASSTTNTATTNVAPTYTNTTNTTHVTQVTYVTNVASAGPTVVTNNTGSGSGSYSGVGGILQEAIDSMKSSLAMAIIDQVDAAVSPLSDGIAANARAIADIEKYTNIAIQGSSFDNGTITNSSLSNVTISSSTFSGSSVTTDDLTVNGTATFGGAMTLSTTTVNGAFVVNGNISDTGTTTLNNAVIASGTVTNLTATNATLTNATSTNFFATDLVATNGNLSNLNVSATTSTGGLSVGNLNGFLKATAGAISTSLIDLTTDVKSVLPVSNGGTGTSSFATNGIVYGNGTNNLLTTTQGGANTVLVANNGAPSFSSAITVGTSISTPYLMTTNASTTNLTVAGNLYVPGSVASNLTPLTNDTYDLGTPELYYHNAFVDTLTVNSISAASTSIAGTVSPTFTLNSANTTNDAISMSLIFFRGMATPNAVLAWDAVNKYFNFNQLVNFAAGATTTQFTSTGSTYLATNGGRVGIGTSTPAVAFDIYGTDALRLPVGTSLQRPTGDTGYIRYNTTTHQFEGYGDNNVWQGLGGVINAAQTTYITAGDDNFLRFVTNGTERMTISNTGEVVMDNDLGVTGTATAGNIIDTGVTPNTLIYANGSKQLASATIGNGLTLTSGTLAVSTTSLASGFFQQGGNAFGATATLGTTDNNQLNLITNNSPRLSITSAGNVGIGTTSPFAALSVVGTGYVSGSLTAADTFFAGLYSTTTTGPSAWTEQTNSPTGERNLDATPDGSQIIASNAYNPVSLSTDYGVTWTPLTGSGSHNWHNVTISSDGSHMAAADYYGYIYTSTNSGVTWTTQTSSGNNAWSGLSMSSDGSHILAAPNGNNLTLSSDYGSTWVSQTGPGIQYWDSADMSSDGSHLIAAGGSGYVYTSINGGSTWTQQTSLGTNSWNAVSVSSDGTHFAAAASGDDIYTSANAGTSWTHQTGSGTASWTSLAESSDGSHLIAGTNGGYIYSSSDYGVTWTAQTTPGTGSWSSVITSSDGTHSAAVVYGDYVWTSSPSVTQASKASFVVASSHNVGIGTTTPGDLLDVISATTNARINVQTSASGSLAGYYLQNSTNQQWAVAVGNGFGLANTSFSITDQNRAAPRFVIDTSGNVGIGTTTPSSILHVSLNGTPIITNESLASAGNSLFRDKGSDGSLFDFRLNGPSSATNPGVGIISLSTQNPILFIQSGVENMRITSAGSVGIGTASPGSRLDVAGSINIDQFSSYKQAGNTILYASSTNSSVTLGYQAGKALMSTSTVTNDVAIGYQALAGNLGNADLNSNPGGGSNVAVGYLALTSDTSGDSNVAVGPSALAGNTTGLANTAVGSAALRSAVATTENTAMGLSAAPNLVSGGSNSVFGAFALANATSGAANTIIGTGALDVLTTGSNNTVIGENAAINMTSGSNNIFIGQGINAPSATGSNQLNIGNILFGAGLTGTGSTIAGNIGIGTSTPFTRLQVESGNPGITYVPNFRTVATFDSNSGGGLAVSLISAANTSAGFFFGTPSVEAQAQFTYNDTAGNFTLYSGGQVQQTFGITSTIGTSTAPTNGTTLTVSPAGPTLTTVLNVTNTSNSSLFDVLTNGNVGIGTSSPMGALAINTGANTGVVVGQDNGASAYNLITLNGNITDTGFLGLAGGSSADSALYIQGGNSGILFRTNGGPPKMTLTGAGSLGIGVISPAQKLDVAGNVNVGALNGYYINNSPELTASTTQTSVAVGNGGGINQPGNVAIGWASLGSSSGGNGVNMAIGNFTLLALTTGDSNVGVGGQVLGSLTTGSRNVAIGRLAGGTNNGSGNILLGYQSGADSAFTSSSNILLGQNVVSPSPTTSGILNIGNLLYGTGLYNNSSATSSTPVLGNIGIGTTTPFAQFTVAGITPGTALGTAPTGNTPLSMVVQGRYAYTANRNGSTVTITDISTTTSPTTVSTLTTSSGAYAVAVQGRYVYINESAVPQMEIADVTDPKHPVIVGVTPISGASNDGGSSIAVSGQYVYNVSSSANTLNIINVSNPSAPINVSTLTGLSGAHGVFLKGKYAYVVGSGNIYVVDISNPAAPYIVGSKTTLAAANSLWVQDSYAYVVENGKLQVFNIVDPTNPVSVGSAVISSSLTTGDDWSIVVQGRDAYVVGGFVSTGGIQVFDISNPAVPVSIGVDALSTAVWDVAIDGRTLIALEEGSNAIGLFDIGGTYTQQLEAGGLEASTLSVRNDLTADTGAFLGGLNVNQSLDVNGNVAFTAASSTLNTTASIFSIATAKSTSPILSVLGNGNVGIGTSSPSYLLSVANGTAGTQAQFGNSAFISNYANGAYFSNATLSSGGVWTARAPGSTIVQADSSGYNVYVNGSLTPGSTFSPTPVMQINAAGLTSVGIGNSPGGWSGNQNYSVASQGTPSDSWGFSADVNGGTTGGAFLDDTTNTSLGLMVMYYNHSAQVGSIYTNGSSVSYNTTSDRRLKTNIVPTNEGLSLLEQIPVDDFNYISQPGATQQGYIAQDLYNYYPIAVHVGGANPQTDPWSVDYGRLTPLLVSSLQQLANGYSLSTTTASSTVASSYAGVSAPAIFVDSTGNVGIGTGSAATTTLGSKIVVNGDASIVGTVYGNSFVATGAGANFSTMYGSVAVGTTTATSVLSPDGKNVDVFKLATFALSGVQQLEAQQTAIATQTASLATQVTSLSQRVSALEAGAAAGLQNVSTTSSSSILAATSTQLASALESFGILLQDGLAQFNTLVVRNLVFSKDSDGTSAAGSGTVLAGNTTVEIDNVDMLATSQVSVTLTSPLTGNWYVSNKQNGSFRVTLSSAQTADVTFDYVIIQTQGQIATSTPTGYLGSSFSWINALFGGSSSTPSNGGQVSAGIGDSSGSGTTGTTTDSTSTSTPAGAPTVILNGAPAISLNQNDVFIDPGATAHDATGADISSSIQETGSVDTATPGIYTLTYTATDGTGVTGSASRVVTVSAGGTVSGDTGNGTGSTGSTSSDGSSTDGSDSSAPTTPPVTPPSTPPATSPAAPVTPPSTPTPPADSGSAGT